MKPDESDFSASLVLPTEGLAWSDLVAVLNQIPHEGFLESKPAPFLLELPDEVEDLVVSSTKVRERPEYVARRLKTLASVDLTASRVFYLATRANRSAISVGRVAGADVQLPLNTVSKRHAELLPGKRWRLRDLEPANGTTIEGKRMPAGVTLPLRSGTVLGFSGFRALFLEPRDLIALLPSGTTLSVDLREVCRPVRRGRRLRDVVEALASAPEASRTKHLGFLLQVPIEDEALMTDDLAGDEVDADLTQAVSRTRILHLQRSRKVGEARLHVVVPSPSGVTLGRADTADLVLPEGSVSKVHAKIHHDGASWRIVDLDSHNGTYVEKKRLPNGVSMPLRPGQGLFLSSYRALFLQLKHLVQLAEKMRGNL